MIIGKTRIDPNDFDRDLNLAVIEKGTSLIGGLSLRSVNGNRFIANVGYAFAPKFHGQGYGTDFKSASLILHLKSEKLKEYCRYFCR